MKLVNLFLSVLLFIMIPVGLFAHPGHGDHMHDGFSIIHYFTEPEHGLVTIGILVSIAVAFYYKYQTNRKKI